MVKETPEKRREARRVRVSVPLDEETVIAVERWRLRQPGTPPSRPNAIATLVAKALNTGGNR